MQDQLQKKLSCTKKIYSTKFDICIFCIISILILLVLNFIYNKKYNIYFLLINYINFFRWKVNPKWKNKFPTYF